MRYKFLKIKMLLFLFIAIAITVKAGNIVKPAIDDKGFIRNWLLAGPYPSYNGTPLPRGYTDDLLMNFGGEKKVIPYKGLKDKVIFIADKAKLIAGIGSVNEWGFTQSKNVDITWQEILWAQKTPIISLDGKFGEFTDNIVAYAACYIVSPFTRQASIKLGSDDGYKLYVNGTFIGGVSKSRGAMPDQNRHVVKINKGINLILLKIVDRIGGHGFCLQLTDIKGQPFDDIQISASHPGRSLAQKCSNLNEINIIDKNIYGLLKLKGAPFSPGIITLRTGLCSKIPADYKINYQIISPDKKIIFSKNMQQKLVANKALIKSFKCNFKAPGDYLIRVTVKGNKTSVLERNITVISPHIIARQLKANRDLLISLQQKENVLKKELKKEKLTVIRLRKYISKQYSRIENLYTLRTKIMKRYYGKAGKSIDQPFKRQKVDREKICLNGDGWQLAAARMQGGKFDQNNPPQGNWSNIAVPYTCVERYFRYRYFPVAGKGDKYYGPTYTLPCGGDYKFNDTRMSLGVWYRTNFSMNKDDSRKSFNLLITNINYYSRIYLNGKYCGDWKGSIGFMNIPLKGLKKGQNKLDIFVASRKLFEPKVKCRFWGIRGDVYLIAKPKVRVEDVWVGTRLRNSRIDTVTEIHNASAREQKLKVIQYCVKAGRIKLKIMEKKIIIPAGKTDILKSSHPWTDPLLWGIGGIYGAPQLYQLVTEVWDGKQIIDQHFTRFGFREFWIAGCHFYLNGKRIFLQGDLGMTDLKTRRHLDVHLKLMRDNNINIIRNHDSDTKTVELPRVADEQGMLVYANMYPRINSDWSKPKWNSNKTRPIIPLKKWYKTYMHQENLLNYSRWLKMMRNHPSVVILSSDNEIFTQAWDRPPLRKENHRNDTLAAWYGEYVKKLDPTRILTRDGDVGTWDWENRFRQKPPCETANYHYPEFAGMNLIRNWETLYGKKPVIFGETLYVSYGAWDGWCGALPRQVEMKAAKCRKFLKMFCDYDVPAAITMGIAMDGFIELNPQGAGPWKVTSRMRTEYKKNGFIKELPFYPFYPIKWPSKSGPGVKKEFYNISVDVYGARAVNWLNPSKPIYIDNAVNKAYKECFRKMPPVSLWRVPELLVKLKSTSRAVKLKKVTLRPVSNIAANASSIICDKLGTAHFVLELPGEYDIEVDGKVIKRIVIEKIPNKLTAGWGYLKPVIIKI